MIKAKGKTERGDKMSKAQGDGYRTWTNKGLNDYKARLNEKLSKMMDVTAKWYDNDGFVILAKSWNTLYNPNGDWKWNGWQVTGKKYQISMFDADDVTLQEDGTYDVNGVAIVHQIFTDKDKANDFFRSLRY